MIKKIKKALSSFFMAESGSETVLLVRTLYAPDGRHRVCFFRREEDGVCGFREEFFDDKILEMNWRPISGEPAAEYPDMAAAEVGAKAEVHWLHLVIE